MLENVLDPITLELRTVQNGGVWTGRVHDSVDAGLFRKTLSRTCVVWVRPKFPSAANVVELVRFNSNFQLVLKKFKDKTRAWQPAMVEAKRKKAMAPSAGDSDPMREGAWVSIAFVVNEHSSRKHRKIYLNKELVAFESMEKNAAQLLFEDEAGQLRVESEINYTGDMCGLMVAPAALSNEAISAIIDASDPGRAKVVRGARETSGRIQRREVKFSTKKGEELITMVEEEDKDRPGEFWYMTWCYNLGCKEGGLLELH